MTAPSISGQSSSAPPLPSDGAPEPCPTPLAWREVLDEVRAHRRRFAYLLDDVPVHAAAFGEGPPLYFLNGASGDGELFALTAWLLRSQQQCVFLDYPPLDLTSRPAKSLSRLSQALIAAANHLRHDRFAVYAAGFGSLVALETMLTVPKRMRAAILACGYAHRHLSAVERGLIAWGTVFPGPLRMLPGWKGTQVQNHRAWFPPFDPSRWDFLRQNLGATATAQAARRLAIAGGVDLTGLLPDIEDPVLLIRTEGEGRVEAACQQVLEDGLGRVRAEDLHSSGQLPHLTHPHRVAKLVSAFLSDHRGALQ